MRYDRCTRTRPPQLHDEPANNRRFEKIEREECQLAEILSYHWLLATEKKA